MQEPVAIVDYDPSWVAAFERERERVAAALGGRVARIEHVGSTAVPGLAAKPVVDLDAVLGDPAGWEACVAPLAACGYEHVPRGDFAGRRFFRRFEGPVRVAHLSLVGEGTAFLEQHLALRDRLRRVPELAAAYGALKRELAAAYGSDRDGYTFAKTRFVLAALRPENAAVLAFLAGRGGSHEETAFRLRRVAATAGLDAVDHHVDGAAVLTTGGGLVTAFALGTDALYLPLERRDLDDLTPPRGDAPVLAGWTAVAAYQPELAAGEGLRRLAAALRRAWGRATG